MGAFGFGGSCNEPYYNYNALNLDNIRQIVNHPATDTIYMTLMKDRSDYSQCPASMNISTLRAALQERCAISPHVRSRGNFNFPVGMTEPDNNLSIVKMGFTINQHNKQK